jgi:transposase-like protein
MIEKLLIPRNEQEKPDPDPEVTIEQEGVEKADRRQFSAEYKRRILQEYEASTELGEKGALLRWEGIYSSYITTWRRQQERGELDGLTAKQRGPKRDTEQEELSRVKDENRRLQERLRQAELIIEAQKKSLRYLVWRKSRKQSPNNRAGCGFVGGSGGFGRLSSLWHSSEFILCCAAAQATLCFNATALSAEWSRESGRSPGAQQRRLSGSSAPSRVCGLVG